MITLLLTPSKSPSPLSARLHQHRVTLLDVGFLSLSVPCVRSNRDYPSLWCHPRCNVADASAHLGQDRYGSGEASPPQWDIAPPDRTDFSKTCSRARSSLASEPPLIFLKAPHHHYPSAHLCVRHSCLYCPRALDGERGVTVSYQIVFIHLVGLIVKSFDPVFF